MMKVFVDDVECGCYVGGYLLFEIDFMNVFVDGEMYMLVFVFDNCDYFDVLFGKLYVDFDFCWYGGFYCEVELCVYLFVYIIDFVGVGEMVGGGVFVCMIEVFLESVVVSVRMYVCNSGVIKQMVLIGVELFFDGQ